MATSGRILVVDDKPSFLTLLRNILRGGGYEVHAAASGPEAMKIARTILPHVILLDTEMPGMDGFETCRRLKADPLTAAIPVAMLTDAQDAQLNQKAFTVGAEATIVKTMSAERLLNMAKVVLTTARRQRRVPRVLVALAVEYEEAERLTSAETLDLGEDGMFIKAPSPANLGTLLLLKFALPGGPPWACSAKVVWIRRPEDEHPYPPGMGVRFMDLQAEARKAIAAFVAAAKAAPAQSRSA